MVERKGVPVTSSARIILDSVGPNGARLTTFELTYPRFIHSELMTHRMLSRNSASSRAIPVAKLIERIERDPALPVFWGRNMSGMQAREELREPLKSEVKRDWLELRDIVVKCVKVLQVAGLHKQIANRPLEPWMDITVIATATHWENMRALRVHPDAQPEFDEVMRKAFKLYDESKPQQLHDGQWHLPFVTGYDEGKLREPMGDDDEGNPVPAHDDEELCLISAGRCAAVSYLNHDTGKSEPLKDLDRASKLMTSGHMSPFEHQAMALSTERWNRFGAAMMIDWVKNGIPPGNIWGFRQLRKTLKHEWDFSLMELPDPKEAAKTLKVLTANYKQS